MEKNQLIKSLDQIVKNQQEDLINKEFLLATVIKNQVFFYS